MNLLICLINETGVCMNISSDFINAHWSIPKPTDQAWDYSPLSFKTDTSLVHLWSRNQQLVIYLSVSFFKITNHYILALVGTCPKGPHQNLHQCTSLDLFRKLPKFDTKCRVWCSLCYWARWRKRSSIWFVHLISYWPLIDVAIWAWWCSQYSPCVCPIFDYALVSMAPRPFVC